MGAPVFTAHRRAAPALARAAAVSGWIGLATLAGCIPTAPNLAPGTESLPCTGPACVPLAGGAPVTTAPTVDCDDAQIGVEFAPFTVLDNETPNLGLAEYFYQYVDGTAGLTPSAYSPPAILADRCTKAAPGSNYVYHTSGGPFTGWGGGLGVALAHLSQDFPTPTGSGLCTSPAPSVVCPAAGGFTTSTLCYCPPDGTDASSRQIRAAALDVSQWDGISLWARRGPNSQPLMRVLVGDKYTDDDISYLMYVDTPSAPRYCERKADCGCNYQDTTCSFYSGNPVTDPTYSGTVVTDKLIPDPTDPTNPKSNGSLYCGAPKSHPGSASQNSLSSNGLVCPEMSIGCASNFCGQSVCDAPYAAYATGADPQFVGKPCTTYTYRNGTQSNVCYDPAKDPPPPESDEQCGDHFTFPINLSTEWQFYKIPFTEMFQQGWAKQAPTFDLTSVSVVRFTWDVGYIDYYIDDVKFYRAKRGSGDAGTP